MVDNKDKEHGLLYRIFSNKDIQKGIALFSIALIMAFSAIMPVTEGEVEEDSIVVGYRFSLERTEYEQYLEDGPIDRSLEEAFEDEGYGLHQDTELSEADGSWYIYENDTHTYRIEIEDENLEIYEEVDSHQQYVRINYPGYNIINGTLELDFEPREEGTELRVEIQNRDFEALEVITLTRFDNHSFIDLTEIDWRDSPRFLNITLDGGSMDYTYSIDYSRRPLRLLSLPALFFTFIGMVYAFKGKGVILGEIKRKQMEEEEREKMQERKEEISEEDVSSGPDDREVIYEGDGTSSKESKGDADHISFMGLPEDEDDESDEEDQEHRSKSDEA